MRALLIASLLLGSATATNAEAAGFSLTSKVGAARSDGGLLWVCVIVDSTHARCAHGNSPSAMTWCDPYAFGNPKTVATSESGMYLVQNFHEQMLGPKHITANAFFVRSSGGNAGTYDIHEFELAVDANQPHCVYNERALSCPSMDSTNDAPDLSPRLGLTGRDANDHVFVFAVATGSNSGGLCGFDIQGSGLGNATALYSAHVKGIIPNTALDPGPIAASISTINGASLVGARDANSGGGHLTLSAVYYDPAGAAWHYLQGSQLASGGITYDIGDGIAIANMHIMAAVQPRHQWLGRRRLLRPRDGRSNRRRRCRSTRGPGLGQLLRRQHSAVVCVRDDSAAGQHE